MGKKKQKKKKDSKLLELSKTAADGARGGHENGAKQINSVKVFLKKHNRLSLVETQHAKRQIISCKENTLL